MIFVCLGTRRQKERRRPRRRLAGVPARRPVTGCGAFSWSWVRRRAAPADCLRRTQSH